MIMSGIKLYGFEKKPEKTVVDGYNVIPIDNHNRKIS